MLNDPVNFIDPLGLDCSMGTDGVMRCTSWAPGPPAELPLWTKQIGYGCLLNASSDPACQYLLGGQNHPAGAMSGGGGGSTGTSTTQKVKDAILNNAVMDWIGQNADYLPGVCTAGAFGFATGGLGNEKGGVEGGLLVDKQLGSPKKVELLGEASYGPVGVGATPSEVLVFVQPGKASAGAVFAADPSNGFINKSGISIGFWVGRLGHAKPGAVPVAWGAGGGGYLTFSSAANCLGGG